MGLDTRENILVIQNSDFIIIRNSGFGAQIQVVNATFWAEKNKSCNHEIKLFVIKISCPFYSN